MGISKKEGRKTSSSSLPTSGIDFSQFAASEKWFNLEKTQKKSKNSKSDTVVNKILKEDIRILYFSSFAEFDSLMKKDKEQAWLRSIAVSSTEGTLSDRTAALVQLIESSPVFSIPYLKRLLSMTQKKNVKEATLAIDSLKNLYISNLLPVDRKLRFFNESQDSFSNQSKDGIFSSLLCYFEDALKGSFAAFVQILCDKIKEKNSLPIIRDKAINAVFDLLRARPEQEKALLEVLVYCLRIEEVGGNKNQPQQNQSNQSSEKKRIKSLGAKTVLLLKRLCNEHERMKEAVIAEVQNQHVIAASKDLSFFFRTVYYPVIFMSCLNLDEKNDCEAAAAIVKTLIHIVILCSQFDDKKKNTSETGETKQETKKENKSNIGNEYIEKIIRLCLEGLEKAFAIAVDGAVITSEISAETEDALLRLCYSSSSAWVSVAVICFLYQAMKAFKKKSSKLTRAIYYHCGNVLLMQTGAPGRTFTHLVSSFVEHDMLEDPTENYAIIRRLLQTILCLPDPCHVKGLLRLISTKLPSDFVECASKDKEGSYVPNTRDPKFAFASSEPQWESIAINNHCTENLIISEKKHNPRKRESKENTASDLLGTIIQPEKCSAEFAERYMTIKKSRIEATKTNSFGIDQDDEDGDMDNEILEDMIGDDIEFNEDDIGSDDDEAEEEVVSGSDFGEDFDSDPDAVLDLQDEDEADIADSDSDQESPLNIPRKKKKINEKLKRFEGRTFVSADEVEEYLLD